MTVTTINKRMLEQGAATIPASTAGKSSEDAAAEFTSALQQAASSLFSGASSARTPTAVDSLGSHFDRQADLAAQPKAAPAAERTDKTRAAKQDAKAEKTAERAERKAVREEKDADRVQAKNDTKGDTVEQTEAETVTTGTEATVVEAADDTRQTVAPEQQQIQPEAVAALVEAPVQQAQQQVETAEETTTVLTKAATETVDTPVRQQAAEQDETADTPVVTAQDTQAETDAQAPVLAAAEQADSAAQTVKRAGKSKGGDDAAQIQADDLAQRLNDTGAQIKMQVEASGPAKPTAAQTAADDVVVTPTVTTAATVLTAETTSQDQGADGGADLLAAQQPGGPLQAPQQQNAAAQVKPFDAILAAQAEAANGPDAAAPQAPTSQPVAGIGAASGTAAAQKAQAPQAAQAPRQPQMPQPHEVIDQIKVQIASQSKDGVDTIKVQLKPTELGAIEIKLDVAKDGSVTTVVTADNKDTLDLLKKDQSSLQKALSDAGLKSDLGSMTFNLREGNQQQANQQQNGGGNMGRRRARLEAAAAADAASAKAAAAAQARWGMGRSGVDIQV